MVLILYLFAVQAVQGVQCRTSVVISQFVPCVRDSAIGPPRSAAVCLVASTPRRRDMCGLLIGWVGYLVVSAPLPMVLLISNITALNSVVVSTKDSCSGCTWFGR